MLVPFSLLCFLPCARRAISFGNPCSHRTLYFPLRCCQYYLIFPVSTLRTALILYSVLMVESAARLISLFTRCWSFGGNWTDNDTKLLDSRFSKSLNVGRGVH